MTWRHVITGVPGPLLQGGTGARRGAGTGAIWRATGTVPHLYPSLCQRLEYGTRFCLFPIQTDNNSPHHPSEA